jgi:hypothetical protein
MLAGNLDGVPLKKAENQLEVWWKGVITTKPALYVQVMTATPSSESIEVQQ